MRDKRKVLFFFKTIKREELRKTMKWGECSFMWYLELSFLWKIVKKSKNGLYYRNR